MEIKFNYYLKVKKIMERDYDVLNFNEPVSIKEMITNNLDKSNKIDLSEILIISDGKTIDDLNMLIDKDTVFSICPKIYGG